MKNIILKINTAKEPAEIELVKANDLSIIKKSTLSEKQFLSEKLLQTIDQILKEEKFNLKNIKFVVVNSGPGSYTSLRIGLVAANLLAFSLNIPVYSSEIELKKIISGRQGFVSPVMPIYLKAPKITHRKTRL